MKPQRLFTSSTAIAVMLTIISALMSATSVPAPSLALGPHMYDSTGFSNNWSGYAITGPSGSVSDVKGSWIVPAILGGCPLTNQYSSFWVGIDGFTSSTVEQTGTDSDCRNGVPVYFAWFEFFPHPAFIITGLTIRPGDRISAETSFNGRSFIVSMRDLTTGQHFSTSSRVKGAQRSSAEWITEAPSSSSGILPLADFGIVSLGYDNTGVSTTCYASVGGTTGPIGAFGSSIQQIIMVSKSGIVKAEPSSLSSDGTSFSVFWDSAGP